MARFAIAAAILAGCGESADEVTGDGTSVTDAETVPGTVATTTTTRAPTTREPIPASTATEIVITAPALYPEGLTYDPVGERFIVGSLLSGELVAVDDDGSITPVAPSPGSNLTGIEADEPRNRLLVAVTGLPSGTAQLSVHDLTSGEQLELVDFAAVQPDERRFANGITVAGDGTIYVTDTGAGVIYAVDSSYVPSVFADNDAFEPDRSGITASGLNGIVHAGDVLIAGHAPSGQLYRVPLTDPSEVTPIPTGVDGMRIDGLHMNRDGSMLAVVSNLGSVHLFESVDGWSTASEVDRLDLGDSFPTSVTDRDGTFFVLQAHLDKAPDPSVDTFEIVPVPRSPNR